VYDENKVGKCLIAIWRFILPALLKEFIELVPLL
jgi:hypothetical protein